jgi:hypothetical protein
MTTLLVITKQDIGGLTPRRGVAPTTPLTRVIGQSPIPKTPHLEADELLLIKKLTH